MSEYQSKARITASPLFLNNRVDRLFWSEDLSERLVREHAIETTNTYCFAAIVLRVLNDLKFDALGIVDDLGCRKGPKIIVIVTMDC